MKKQVVLAAAVLGVAVAQAVPTAESRAAARAKAEALVKQLTGDECVSELMMESKPVDRLGIPAYHWWNEALHGVARAGLATMFPQAIGAAATFDPELEQKMADVISTEARAKYNLFRAKGAREIYEGLTLWSPNVNMFRDPLWGRGQETFGEDPYLSGVMGTAFVKGLQGDDPKYLKTAACAKHYAVHSGPEKLRHEFNVDVDDRDLYEYYLPAFRALVVDGKVESVMGAYSAVNGIPCCANKRLLTDILRGEWGFQGHVVSDVGAVGDISSHHKYKPNSVEGSLAAIEAGLDLCSEGTYSCLRKEVAEGRVKKEQLYRPLVNLFTTRYLLGNIGDEKTPWDSLGEKDIATPEHLALSLKVAEKSMVLVKNNGVLPLDPAKISKYHIFGRDNNVRELHGNYEGTPTAYITGRLGINMVIGKSAKQERNSDVAFAFVGIEPGDEGEDHDRKNTEIYSRNLEDLRKNRQERPNQKIVSIVYGGSVLDLAEVVELSDAVILAWYPGEQGGLAIARTIFGMNNPGGRLPLTYMEKNGEKADIKDYKLPGRTYLYADKKPLFPFGYGLSYTTFGYSALKVAKAKDGVTATVKVTNTGKVAGDEVVQLYVRSPKNSGDRRRHHLEGFKRVTLKPGESKTVSFSLKPEQLMQFGMDGKQSLAKGEYTIFVGGGQPGFADGVMSAKVGF